jgi:hypothetical protein
MVGVFLHRQGHSHTRQSIGDPLSASNPKDVPRRFKPAFFFGGKTTHPNPTREGVASMKKVLYVLLLAGLLALGAPLSCATGSENKITVSGA